MNTGACGFFLSAFSGIAFAACSGATALDEPPAFDGRYVGSWQFILRDSTLLLPPFGCGFAACGSPSLRPYATITCEASLEIRNTGVTIYPRLNTPARELTGALTLAGCTAQYDSQPIGFVGLPPLPPQGLVTVAERTDLMGWASWEEVTESVGRWHVGLALQNTTGSIGELLGCSAESKDMDWQFGALLRQNVDDLVAQGNVASTHVNGPLFRCGEYVLFLDSPFHLQRG